MSGSICEQKSLVDCRSRASGGIRFWQVDQLDSSVDFARAYGTLGWALSKVTCFFAYTVSQNPLAGL